MAALTPRQKAFVDEYLIDLNATQAARRAGYKDPNIGRQLIAKNNVSSEISKRQKERAVRVGITQDMVLREFAAIGFADILDFVELEKDGGVVIKPTVSIPKDKRTAIASIKQGANGVEIRLNDKLRALEMIGKHLGMFSGVAENGEGESGLSVCFEGSLKEAAE